MIPAVFVTRAFRGAGTGEMPRNAAFSAAELAVSLGGRTLTARGKASDPATSVFPATDLRPDSELTAILAAILAVNSS